MGTRRGASSANTSARVSWSTCHPRKNMFPGKLPFSSAPQVRRARTFASFALCALVLFAAGRAYAQTTDTITFNDGEQLAGKLISVLGGTVTFHSEILGNVTVPLEKVKTLHTAHAFAVVKK